MDYATHLKTIDTPDGRLFAAAPGAPWIKAIVLCLGCIGLYGLGLAIVQMPAFEEVYCPSPTLWYELDTVIIVSILFA